MLGSSLLDCPGVAAAALEYEVIDLGTLGGTSSVAQGVNDRGQVVGWSLDADGRTQAFFWQNGTMTGLGFLPGGTSSVANAINNNGEITGNADVSPTNFHAFLYASNNLVDLGTLGGPNSCGRAINDRGDITGCRNLRRSPPDPEDLRLAEQPVHPHSALSSAYSCDGFGINEEGRICGITFLYSPNPRWWAYVWYDSNTNGLHDTGEMKLLGSLGSPGT